MTPARQYFASRAISPRVAFDCGVRPGTNPNELIFPSGRRRILDQGKVLNPTGKPSPLWWVVPRVAWWDACLICEGESDSLAAATALCQAPEPTGLRTLPILCVPGTQTPAERIVTELEGIKQVFVCFDADMPKRKQGSDELVRPGQEAAKRAADALYAAGVWPVVVELPLGKDLAAWLAGLPEHERGDRIADLLIDSEMAAPTMDDLNRANKIEYHQEQIDLLRAA